MRTTDSHPYHGISLTNGHWRIQIRLLDKYRLVRAYASNAEDAARRHDIMMKRLEMFLPPALEPNFPDEYDAIDMAKWMTEGEALENPQDEKFRDMLLHWDEVLTHEATRDGWDDLAALASHYKAERRYIKAQSEKKITEAQNARFRRVLAALPGVVTTLTGQSEWVTNLTKNLDNSELDIQDLKGFSDALEVARTLLQNYISRQ